ncbi:MAG: bifunctional methylenetetrahydrofolate dehydrogenase/methenyltetrahydrofolate cyclohydrolase FolD [Candidatus Eremiobacteraeota bacterium]|nr:bifunctional methylenetetrahydrofolate dehydrogenase/methenyltetrahydrofolate cyclohydrolase FolD [Candidatus Eremiobacteraeota bacterium]
MAAKLLDGKAIAKELQEGIAAEVKHLSESRGIVPGLHVVLAGEDPASQVYVKNKHRTCEKLGFSSVVHSLPKETGQRELLDLVRRLNEDRAVHGILVQLPLPSPLDSSEIMMAIDPRKDVDGFHPVNLGRLLMGDTPFPPCTPYGIMELLGRTGVDLKGKEAVVIGRSTIVGKPLALLLLQGHATVTICHSKTKNLEEVARRADILVAAIGKANFVTSSFVKEGAVVIDVGINRLADGKLAGDVSFEEVRKIASWITPVPGGVGPMTIAMLMRNTLRAAQSSPVAE